MSYNDKHNDANGEANRDGESHNRSWNCGAEGPTEDADVIALRAQQQRNFIATLCLSQGIPMLLAGDEIGRTQGGNNNADRQDNDISWVDWQHADRQLLAFTASLIMLRHSHPVFRRRHYFLGRPIHGAGITDIGWYRPDGEAMNDEDWSARHTKSIAVFLNGDALNSLDMRGEPVTDDSFFIACNAHHEAVTFTLPGNLPRRFSVVVNTHEPLMVRMKPKPAIHALLPDLQGPSTHVAVAEPDGAQDLTGGHNIVVPPRSHRTASRAGADAVRSPRGCGGGDTGRRDAGGGA